MSRDEAEDRTVVCLMVVQVKQLSARIPEHLRRNEFVMRDPHVPSTISVITGAHVDEVGCDFYMQARIIDVLNVPNMYTLIADMARGSRPHELVWCNLDNVASERSDDSRLLWFATMLNCSKSVVIDVTEWWAFPTMRIVEFPCIRNTSTQRTEHVQASLRKLANHVYDLKGLIPDGLWVDIFSCSKDLYELTEACASTAPP